MKEATLKKASKTPLALIRYLPEKTQNCKIRIKPFKGQRRVFLRIKKLNKEVKNDKTKLTAHITGCDLRQQRIKISI